MVKVIKFIIIFHVCLFLIGCVSKKEIAVFDNGVVYFYEAIDEYKKLSDENKDKFKSIDEYYKFIRKIALKKIILNKVYKEGLDKKENILKLIERAKKDTAFEILKKKNVLNKIIIGKNDYKKYQKKYELYQIVKRIDILDDANIIESRKMLKKTSKEIKDLSSFMNNAKKLSNDITASEGGYVGKIRLGIMEKDIDEVIKKLEVKKVSDVVESSTGLHLFFINNIEENSIKELYKDKELYKLIYEEKRNKEQEAWYEKLLKDPGLKINEEIIKEKTLDDEVAVEYKNKKITRNELFKTVDRYKQDVFPEPTYDELLSLVKNMGLSLIIEEKSMNKVIINSKDFKEKQANKIKFLLINEYIQSHIIIPDIKDQDIKKFYNKNIKTLFTFKLDNGSLYIQPINEVRGFISKKIKAKNKKEARYQLYRKLVEEDNLDIDKNMLEVFKKKVEK